MNGSNSRSRATRSAWSSMLSFAARNALWFAATRSVIVSVAIRAVVLPDRSREKRLHRLAGREGRSAACARTGRVTALGAWQKFGVAQRGDGEKDRGDALRRAAAVCLCGRLGCVGRPDRGGNLRATRTTGGRV